ncbi:MAG: hypothetical protein R3E66_24650 [bacterium]
MKRFVPLIVILSFGCSDVYRLPDPKPGQTTNVNLTPGADDRQGEADYLQARQTIIKLFSLLQQQRYPEAEELLSKETVAFVTYGTDKTFAEVLADGKLTQPNGEVVDLDPVFMLLASDDSRLVDAIPGIEEQETPARKEIFAVLPNDQFQRIVIIKEAGRWVLHRTRIAQTSPIPSV